ncbi:hypothetical protein [Bacillus sp. AFS041924]|uniref:hypothetical protein n=1 Tax=Bacillus sp. AFS041924 TaxID=2033503 RepID=UPI000BFE8E30|nr:hypothetical protein [Bacillus sp. AFS041924]PGS55098.1 hypothetical protein COC46_04020 [Bacillus sp. AFS041924]
MEELNAKFRARSHRLLELGIAANHIVEKGRSKSGRVPTNLVRGLEDFKLSLDAMRDDPRYKSIAQLNIEFVNEVVSFAKAINAGNKEIAEDHLRNSVDLHEKSDGLINALVDEIEVSANVV